AESRADLLCVLGGHLARDAPQHLVDREFVVLDRPHRDALGAQLVQQVPDCAGLPEIAGAASESVAVPHPKLSLAVLGNRLLGLADRFLKSGTAIAAI